MSFPGEVIWTFQYDPCGDQYQLRMGQRLANGNVAVAQSLVLQEHERGLPVPPMAVFESKVPIQQLFNELWSAGFRPTADITYREPQVRKDMWLEEQLSKCIDYLTSKDIR